MPDEIRNTDKGTSLLPVCCLLALSEQPVRWRGTKRINAGRNPWEWRKVHSFARLLFAGLIWAACEVAGNKVTIPRFDDLRQELGKMMTKFGKIKGAKSYTELYRVYWELSRVHTLIYIGSTTSCTKFPSEIFATLMTKSLPLFCHFCMHIYYLIIYFVEPY